MIKNLEITLDGKKLSVEAVNTGFFQRFTGLMFKSKEKSQILLFDNADNYAIHSFFVFFDFLILWLDDKNKVVEWRIVKPFSVYEKSKKQFSRIIEIPINRRYYGIVNVVVGERFKKTYRL
jgi:uncharacterized membrane protein (UPF0127 family)